MNELKRLLAENVEYKRRLRDYKLALATAMGGTVSDTMYDKDLEKAVKAKRRLQDDITAFIEEGSRVIYDTPSRRMRLVLFIARVLRVELCDRRYADYALQALYQIEERLKT